MGMAASQARLLSLTAQLHDVELKAQGLMCKKLELATQKDAIYQEYNDALEATSIKVAYWTNNKATQYVDANYNSMCLYNENRCQQYALKDNNTGKLIVTKEANIAYQDYGNDKYAFAFAMLGFTKESHNWDENHATSDQIGIGTAQDSLFSDIETEIGTGYSAIMTECEQDIYDLYKDEDSPLKEKHDKISEAKTDLLKKDALADFRNYLYTHYSKEIYNRVNINKNGTKGDVNDMNVLTRPNIEWADIENEFKYYINLWEAINDAGGCQEVESEYTSGEDGNIWLQNMLEAGMITIMEFNQVGDQRIWTETSVATSYNSNYLQEMEADETQLKKAEAKYNHELSIINTKDKDYDTELSKLETERSAITKEMESIETVKKENTDRTFGIFS